jgi:hypothetical protein
MLIAAYGAVGAVFFAAQTLTFGTANMTVGFCHTFFFAYSSFIST